MTPAPRLQAKLRACPFCGAQMIVRQHSAFHPQNNCWLATAGECASGLELDEADYPSWNTRPELDRLEKLVALYVDPLDVRPEDQSVVDDILSRMKGEG